MTGLSVILSEAKDLPEFPARHTEAQQLDRIAGFFCFGDPLENFIATCPEETKELLVKELIDLGASEVRAEYKAVHFSANNKQLYTMLLKLRTASRVLWAVDDLSASSEKILFLQARKIKWPNFFDEHRTFLVDAIQTGRGKGHMPGNAISKAIRLGIEDSFTHYERNKPKVDLKDPKVIVVAFVHGKRCYLSFDLCGKSLHKRGYKDDTHPAPLKETLAASVLMLAGYDGSMPLLDPMTGSGTLAIEGAMMALDKAPLIHRKKGEFAIEYLKIFDKDLWRTISDKLREEKSPDLQQPIFASDIRADYVAMAKRNALRARVEKYIQFQTIAFESLTKPAERGLLVCNLPYGARLDPKDKEQQEEEWRTLYKGIGDKLKKDFSGWTAALLVAKDSPYKFIGLHPKRKISLLNGDIPVKLLLFELYVGSKRKGTTGGEA